MQKQISKAVILLSGGQDSTTCLYWALTMFKEVYPIGFNYGQSHSVELDAARNICSNLGLDYKVYDIRGLLTDSSLTNGANHSLPSQYNNELPASFTVGRNILFLAIAGSYCAQVGANSIVTGVCETDYSGYPDCRFETICAMQSTLCLGLGIGDIVIHTPLMDKTKAETWKLASDLNCLHVIINDTVTDYNGSQEMNEWGKGKLNNPASELRAKGYYEAKQKGWV